MKKRWYALLAAVLAVICFVSIAAQGSTYVLELDVSEMTDYEVWIDQDAEVLRVVDQQAGDGVLRLTVESVSKGVAFAAVRDSDDHGQMRRLVVHRSGIITEEEFFGKCSGGVAIPIAISIFFAVLLFDLIRRYRAGMRRSLYQYRNVRLLAQILFLAPILLSQLVDIYHYGGVADAVRSLLRGSSSVAVFAFPVAFVLSILVTISNLRLMRKEGRTWRNMLGCILGLLLCLSTVFPTLLGEFLQRATFVDVHNEKGWALYTELGVESAVMVLVSYLECVLLSTILLSVKAAKKIPAFDKDYILIHGCQIKKDGSLTPLLQGRTDRAIEFARMQKDAAGKDIVFIPSGGKGADEAISEAEAIRRYLVRVGIDEAHILPEGESASTYENLRNSAALIRAREGDAEPKIAIATTNYHVFRAGVLAVQLGLDAEGIGSSTRSYFWINAFIREFIATLSSDRRSHIRMVGALMLNVIAMALTAYLSAVL